MCVLKNVAVYETSSYVFRIFILCSGSTLQAAPILTVLQIQPMQGKLAKLKALKQP